MSVCKTDLEGNKSWRNKSGNLHRENDLPAEEYTSGYKAWYLNGVLHRENGPAAMYRQRTIKLII
jgi:hypothetical protein